MRDIQVSKAQLIEVLEANKAKHRAIYEEAKTNFLKAAAEALQKKLEAVEHGRIVSLHIALPVPEDHTKDYERIIKMLTLELRDEILLSESDHQQFVLDDWAWRRAWVANTMSYTGQAMPDDDDEPAY